jgi:hypothetical protein
MPHRHDDEYLHRHQLGEDSHAHRLVEVIEHAHGGPGEAPHGHTHIVMTDRSARADGGDHRHRLKEAFEHEHGSDSGDHRHRLGDLEHDVADRHWHPVEIVEIELVIGPDQPKPPESR